MKITKDQLLRIYKQNGKLGLLKRQLAWDDAQKIGKVPTDLAYSDEAFAEHIGEEFANLPSQEVANQYLTNVYNKLAIMDFRRISGERNHLFMRGLQDYVPNGDTAELFYTDVQEIGGYDVTKYVPDATKGGSLVQSQHIQLSNIEDATNPDRRLLDVVVPTLLITQALNQAITTGLANGWPTIFDEQMRRSWDKFKFERFRTLLSMAGGTPDNNMWFDPKTKWTANEPSFIKITTPVKDADTFQQFLTQIYTTSSILEGEYHNEYNPVKITQISPLGLQGLFIDSSYEAYWRTTNSVLFNSDVINIKNVYNNVDFVKLMASKVKADAKNVKAILYVEYPFVHYPFTNGVERAVQLFARNRTTAIYDHFWLASGIDLSKNIIVFYE